MPTNHHPHVTNTPTLPINQPRSPTRPQPSRPANQKPFSTLPKPAYTNTLSTTPDPVPISPQPSLAPQNNTEAPPLFPHLYHNAPITLHRMPNIIPGHPPPPPTKPTRTWANAQSSTPTRVPLRTHPRVRAGLAHQIEALGHPTASSYLLCLMTRRDARAL